MAAPGRATWAATPKEAPTGGESSACYLPACVIPAGGLCETGGSSTFWSEQERRKRSSPSFTGPCAQAKSAPRRSISGASSGGCCSLGLRYGARGAGDEPFLLASHRVGEPQGAGARLPGVYFQSSFAVAIHSRLFRWRYAPNQLPRLSVDGLRCGRR